MKKLMLLMSFFLLIAKANAQNGDVYISLNGIMQSDAKKMIDQFDSLKSQDIKPHRQSIWISKSTLDLMVALLLKEQKACEDHVHCTDGVRIYFASSLSKNSGRLNTSIVIVSTRFSAEDINAPSKADHTDYYNHNGQDPLFKKLTAIKGTVYRKTFYRRGEILYDTCTTCTVKDSTCKTDDPHYITGKKAKTMVGNFGQKAMVTDSEWFDLDLLQAFDDCKTLDGIRIYFSRHSVDDVSPNQVVSDKDALILVPTYSHGMWPIADHKDFFDCSITNDYFQKYYSKHHLFGAAAGGEDNGELCPSHCD